MLRGLAFSILATALIISLFFIAYGLVFNLVTSNPEKVKSIVAKSSLYSDLPAVIYDQAVKVPENNLTEIPLKDPRVRQIALDVYNPQFVQSNTEKLIDGIYSWLEGNTDEPQISLDFKEKNREFAEKISRYAKKQGVKSGKITPSEANRAADEAKNLFLQNSLNGKDIKTAEGQPVQDSFSDLPKSFAMAKTVPYALIILALVIVAIIFYASKGRGSALKRLSRSLLFAGILIALTPIIFSFTAGILLKKSSEDEQIINMVRSLFEQFMQEAGKVYYVVGAVIILIAAGMYIYSRRIGKDTEKPLKKKS